MELCLSIVATTATDDITECRSYVVILRFLLASFVPNYFLFIVVFFGLRFAGYMLVGVLSHECNFRFKCMKKRF